MKKFKLLTLFAILGISSLSYAAKPESGISSSTDPNKAAAVEQRAEEIRMQQMEKSSGSSDANSASGSAMATDTSQKSNTAHKKQKAKKSKHLKNKPINDTSDKPSESMKY